MQGKREKPPTKPSMPAHDGDKAEFRGATVSRRDGAGKWVIRVPARVAKGGKEWCVDRVFGADMAPRGKQQQRQTKPQAQARYCETWFGIGGYCALAPQAKSFAACIDKIVEKLEGAG